MSIKELFAKIHNLPNIVNVIYNEDHIWIGEFTKMPEEIKVLNFSEAYIQNWSDHPQIVFYI